MNANHPTTKFSVIIPIYNTASFLPKCIDSVTTQGYENLEVILVDDGSTDLSPTICDDYAKKDNRIKVIHKQNEGLSAARNDGILAATGEYILFVDSDDYIEQNTFSTFNSAIKAHPEIDVLTSHLRKIENNKVKYTRFFVADSPMSGFNFLKTQKNKGKMNVSPCIYISRLAFIINNNLFFEKDIREASDNLWCYRVLLSAGMVFMLDFIHYNYAIRAGSITQLKNYAYRGLCMLKVARILETISVQITDDELKAMMFDHIVDLFFKSYFLLRSSNEFKEHSHLFDKKMIQNRAISIKQKRNVALFTISPSLFYYYKKCKVRLSKGVFKRRTSK